MKYIGEEMDSSLGFSKHKIPGGVEWLHHPMQQEVVDIAQESEPQGMMCTYIAIGFRKMHCSS